MPYNLQLQVIMGGGGGGGGELKGYLCTLNAGHVGSNKLAYIGT